MVHMDRPLSPISPEVEPLSDMECDPPFSRNPNTRALVKWAPPIDFSTFKVEPAITTKREQSSSLESDETLVVDFDVQLDNLINSLLPSVDNILKYIRSILS